MKTAFRALGPFSFAVTGLLLVLAYTEDKPPSLITTAVGFLACTMAAVAVWQDW